MFTKSPIESKVLNEKIKNIKPNLQRITILPTLVCNLRCKFCHVWGTNGWALKGVKKINEQLNIDSLKDFINEANKNNKFDIVLSGGEPLLYNSLQELIEFLYSKNIKINILTNGLKLIDHASFLTDHACFISISIDGSAQVHDNIRNKQNLFDTVCNGIEEIIELKSKKSKPFPVIQINYVISEYNYNNISEFIVSIRNRFASLKVNIKFKQDFISRPKDLILTFEPLLFTTKARGEDYADIMLEHLNCKVTETWESFIKDEIKIDSKAVAEVLKREWDNAKINYSDNVDIIEYFENISNVFGRTRCISPWQKLVIGPNGSSYFCPDLPDYSVGNINNNSFEEIWVGKPAEYFRRIMKERLFPVCNRCCSLFSNFNIEQVKE